MARWNDLEWKDDVYAAADIWKERCFLNDTALFNDKSIWTQDNLRTLQQLVVFNPDFGGDNFWEKLRRQTQDANPNVIQLAAELMWLIFLFPLGKQVGDVGPSPKASSKLNKVKEVLSWANLPSPNGKVVNFDALSGIGRSGRIYKHYFHAIRYMLQVSIAFKQFSIQRRVDLLDAQSAWEFVKWSDSFKQETQVPFRHALLFFLFPDNFERAVSASDKEQILRDLIYLVDKGQIAEFLGAGGYESQIAIDRAIFNLRSVLELVHDRTNLDFYRDPIDGSWGKRGPLSMGTNCKLRNYIESPNDHSFVTLRNSLLNQEGSAENDNRSVTNALEAGVAASGLPEGEAKVVMQIIRERDQTLRRRKLNEVIGEIRCECCDTRGGAYQGLQKEIPKERIFEIHHLIPISQYEGAKITDLDEVALLCANCHRAIHTFPNDQMPSVDEFRQQLQKKYG
jgi:hypothetical protein